jgi:hypothetical protein
MSGIRMDEMALRRAVRFLLVEYKAKNNSREVNDILNELDLEEWGHNAYQVVDGMQIPCGSWNR